MSARRVMFVHPSPDLYGSDLQLLESVDAALEGGATALVVVPSGGPLVERLVQRGAEVQVLEVPVLRKAMMSPRGIGRSLLGLPPALARMVGLLRRERPDVLYVNTITVPWWIVAGRLARVATVCHVHEVIDHDHPAVRLFLTAPLRLAHRVVCNSLASRESVTAARMLAPREVRVIYNGVPAGPAESAPLRIPPTGVRLVLVGRISPRKGTDVAVRAVADLVEHGVDVSLTLCGNIFPGYEWFETDLHDLVAKLGLGARVRFLGYVASPRDVLRSSHIVVVPSRNEPFGNVAVEAMFASRLVVASRVQGLCEVVDDGVTGILVEPDDHEALAACVRRAVRDPAAAVAMAARARSAAEDRFSVERYRSEVRSAFAGMRTSR